MQWEPLENRTALSSGFVATFEPPVVLNAAAVNLLTTGAMLNHGWTVPDGGVAQPVILPMTSVTPGNGSAIGPAPLSIDSSTGMPMIVEEDLSTALDEITLIPPPSGAGTDTIGLPAVPTTLALSAAGEAIVNSTIGRTAFGVVAEMFMDSRSVTIHVGDEGFFAPSPIPPVVFMAEFVAWRGYFPTSGDAEEPDMSYAGPLELVESNVAFSTWTSISTSLSAGHANGHSSSGVMTCPSLQFDSNGDLPSPIGLAYAASGGWTTLYSDPSAPATEGSLTTDESGTEPISPASITTGGISLDLLLSGLDLPIEAQPGGVEQVAELVPLPRTSLALAATLWTVPSDTPTTSPRWDVEADSARGPSALGASLASWTLFVTGVEQSLEQSCRELGEEILLGHDRSVNRESMPDVPDELPLWQGPILPVAHGGSSANDPESSRGRPRAVTDDASEGLAPAHDDSRSRSEDAPAVVLAAMPLISAASVSTMIAGWFWRKRQRSRRLTIDSKDSRAC